MLKKDTSTYLKFNPDNKKIVIFVHGFRAVPGVFNELLEKLYNNGFSIYNIRLPGHGLINNDEILKTKLKDWEIYLENIFLDLYDRFEEIYFCGQSLGCALILNLLAKYNSLEKVKKLSFISPLLELKEKIAPFTGIFGIFIKKFYKSDKPDCSIDNEIFKDFIPFFPIPQVFEMYKLTRKNKKNLKKIKTKTLCFLSINDHIIDYYKHLKILSSKNTFIIISLEKSYHNSIIDVDKDLIIQKTISWFNE